MDLQTTVLQAADHIPGQHKRILTHIAQKTLTQSCRLQTGTI